LNNESNESVNTKLNYLLSTGLYEKGTKQHPYTHMYHEQEMLNTDKTVSIKELAERFIEIDECYKGEPWNIKQILNNINMVLPIEDK
jgi:hypothetical protein